VLELGGCVLEVGAAVWVVPATLAWPGWTTVTRSATRVPFGPGTLPSTRTRTSGLTDSLGTMLGL
jgi:hypothetical protein